MSSTVRLQHNRIGLALHRLRDGEGQPLLLLHGLGEQSPEVAPGWTSSWKGAVFALDFTGHGASDVPRGGGYTAETLMADVDVALDGRRRGRADRRDGSRAQADPGCVGGHPR